MLSFLSTLAITLIIVFNVRRIRFYFCMFFASWFFDHPTVAKYFGIEMDDVFTYKKSRRESRIYSDGLFVKILALITGMNLRVSDQVRREMIMLQNKHSKQIDMEQYFDMINGKKMTVLEFEHFLSQVLLVETNRMYQVFNENAIKELSQHSVVVFEILNGLSGGMVDGFIMMFKHVRTLYKISMILRSAPEAQRLMIFGPQLSLVTNFSKMILRCDDESKSFDTLEPNDFLNLKTKFFVFEEFHDDLDQSRHKLVFLKRERDFSDGQSNKAFGPSYIACPGAKLTIDYIQSILSFLQSFDISVEGKAIYEGVRFKNIANKDDVRIRFTKK